MSWEKEVARKYNNKCPHCSVEECSPHHIIPRGCKRTKNILENGIYCCNYLHRVFEGKYGKKKKEKAIDIYVGRERYNNLLKIKRGLASLEDFNYLIIK